MRTAPSTTPETKKDQGFTLIELLVVVVIIGILAAIAIPVFLNQREKAVDSGIQSDLKALATTQETHYVDARAYSVDPAELKTAGFTPTKGNVIGVAIAAGGKAYCLKGTNAGGSKDFYYASDDGGLSDAQSGACTGLLDADFTDVSNA
ncbi:prepilin-type N-terminal cleavage/methylation domain-containing protein [Nocardioides marinisabuli]|uniref:Prepilin-type N-terminal cleavage/methylation domain-containing protein n=1 Tax=Nocardioides marinisabuli TaxID=419476 RepID=A0A7Y9JQQ9_9ACTN|nr:prepilin-type N-terminal cleavage/methylation domain-containing protein [Nocardioides marinisabuli]NYD57670.1 prepilin-type N-terminal cleavage/methylation domain-containing protein [Nocardioides marinisabuli]